MTRLMDVYRLCVGGQGVGRNTVQLSVCPSSLAPHERRHQGVSKALASMFHNHAEDGGFINPGLMWVQARDEVKRKFGGLLPIPGQVSVLFGCQVLTQLRPLSLVHWNCYWKLKQAMMTVCHVQRRICVQVVPWTHAVS